MKFPTWPGARRPRLLTAPPIPANRRMVWWIEIINLVLLIGAPIVVFDIAGGDSARDGLATYVKHLADGGSTRPSMPLAAAFAVFLAALLMGALAQIEGELISRRHFDRWYVAKHPDQVEEGHVARMVQEILTVHGPLSPAAIQRDLFLGGQWGPGVFVSHQGLMRGILCPGGQLAGWLADREPGDPYSVPAAPFRRGAGDTPAATVERVVRLNGPVPLVDLHSLVNEGGEHGHPVPLSRAALIKILRGARWLKPRSRGGLYEHALPAEAGDSGLPVAATGNKFV